MPEATTFLQAITNGDDRAADRLLPLVYDQLKLVAAGLFQHQPEGHSLQPTALVHEAYLKLIGNDNGGFNDHAHFTAVAAIAMRQILVDHARARRTEKRGGGRPRVTLDLAAVDDGPGDTHDLDVLAVHDALEKLAELDERKARVIELRFFGGLDIEQTAMVLGVARSTVTQDWRFARAWLVREIGGDGPGSFFERADGDSR